MTPRDSEDEDLFDEAEEETTYYCRYCGRGDEYTVCGGCYEAGSSQGVW